MFVYRQIRLFLIILLLCGGQILPAQWDWTSGQVTIHTVPPESFTGKDPSVKIGGLSGICYDPHREVYYAIADKAPARFYTLHLDSLDSRPTVLSETRVTYSNLSAPTFVDPESIRITPDGETLIWTNEANSTIYLMDLQGNVHRAIQLPQAYLPGQKSKGIQNNSGLESLAISNDGTTLVVCSEHMLKQDEACGSSWMPPYHPLRLVFLDLATGNILYEKLYYAQNGHGLVDLYWDEDGYLWCLERSWSPLTGNDILVYRAYLNTGSSLKNHPSLCDLDPDTTWPVTTTFVHDFQAERKSGVQRRFDNVEGLCFGQKVASRRDRIILVSDDNFSKSQTTQIIELSIHR